MVIDERDPIADGILFDDLHGCSFEAVNRLAARGVVFVTSFRVDGREYGGKIVARDWAAAEVVAFGRGLGEAVVGRLSEVIRYDG